MLINLRNALMAGKRLPYDAEVEFLESTGTQYILTGVPGGAARWEIGAKANSTTTQVLVSMNREANGGYYFGVLSGVWGFGGSGNNTTIAGTTYADINATIVGTGTSTATVNGQSCSRTQTNTVQTDEWMLFASRPTSFPFYGQIYYARCYQNGVLVRDYIPVRVGQVGYLYDRVSGKLFGNAGTGDFVLGQDVVPVEYIESHGTEHIDIPVSGTPDEYFGIKGLVKITNTSQKNKAVWDTEINRQFGTHGYDPYDAGYMFASWIGNSASDGGWAVPIGTLAPFEVSTLGTTLFGVFHSNPRNITSAFSTLRLFGKYGSTAYTGNASVAFGVLTIADGTGNARNFYPVRVGTGSTWEGAMMDTLTRRIYRNAGTGAFTYGNDLKYPIPAS